MVQKSHGKSGAGYNERLFSGGLRKWVHEARFRWLKEELLKQGVKDAAIVEIGCFDCRALKYIEPDFGSYRGFDADWEGGLSSISSKISDSRVTLSKCTSPEDFKPNACDVVISLETLEHIAPNQLPFFYKEIEKNLTKNGVILISVPNETGPLFAVKQIYKLLFLEDAEGYSFKEGVYQSLGMVENVKRKEHKGFSWRKFKKELSQYFDVQSTKGLQLSYLPAFLNPSIGIVARKKSNA